MNNTISKLLSFMIPLSIFFVACEDYEKDIPEPEIYSDMPDDGYEVIVYDTLEIEPKITYDYNSTYCWILDGDTVSTELDLELIPTELAYYEYTFTVENSSGSDTTEFFVQTMYNNNFRDLILEDDTFSVYNNSSDSIFSIELFFESSGDPFDSDFNGLVYSNLYGSDSDNDYNEIYGAYDESDDYESVIFGVIHQNDTDEPVCIRTADGQNHLFSSMMVNNTYYNYEIIYYGTDSTKTFGGDDGTDKDWFILTIDGYDNTGTKSGSIDYYLADYTYTSGADDYIISDWSKVDLTDLGKVSTLKLSLSSSDEEDDIMLTPAYFCIDEIKIIE
jgi:hypothetical protein